MNIKYSHRVHNKEDKVTCLALNLFSQVVTLKPQTESVVSFPSCLMGKHTRLARQILGPSRGALQLRTTTKMHAGENVEVTMNMNYVGDRLFREIKVESRTRYIFMFDMHSKSKSYLSTMLLCRNKFANSNGSQHAHEKCKPYIMFLNYQGVLFYLMRF